MKDPKDYIIRGKGLLVKHDIPIYGRSFWVGVGSFSTLSEKLRSVFGNFAIDEDTDAACIWQGSLIGVLFDPDRVTHGVVAHEVFHATVRIHEFNGERFPKKTHESYAYLCGYLTDFVYADLKRARIALKG